jgi:hypothetical protein
VEKKTQSQSRITLILPLAVLLVAAIFLSACGGGNAPADNPPQADNPAPVDNSAGNTSEGDTTSSTEAEDPADDQTVADSEVSFSEDVHPILQSRCLTCHGEDDTEAELVMFTYEDLMAGSENGAVIVPGDVENSLLAELIIEQEMPKKGPKLNPVQTQTILNWIAQGAQNN